MSHKYRESELDRRWDGTAWHHTELVLNKHDALDKVQTVEAKIIDEISVHSQLCVRVDDVGGHNGSVSGRASE